LWLFSSGPLGTKETDDQGRDLREFLEPKEIAEFRTIVHPRDHHVFFGAMDSTRLNFTHRLLYKMPANRDNAIFPQGDFRNWPEIDAWASAIAEALTAQ
jgi:menaquinone-dependent protoporphyrinogen oxidase